MARLSFPVLSSLFALLASAAVAVRPLVVQGSQFVDPDKDVRFQIIGVDYQPGGTSAYDPASGEDVLTDPTACLRDAALLQRLGANTIRIYNLNPTLDHDECVSIFNAAGIYLIIDVNSPVPGESLNRAEPWTTYHKGYLTRVFQMIEAFKDYPNTLAFFGANEVINEDAHEEAPRYLRALQRDMKDYIKHHADRDIPVGYSAADVRDILADTWNYLSCDIADEPSSRIDFFGLNSYSWCGDSSYTTSGYDQLVALFSGTSNPVFFSEYGCNEVQPRIFTEVQALYGEDMTDVFGGGLIYEYTQESNDYGLVKLGRDHRADLLIDYENLLGQYRRLDMDRLQSLNATAAEIEPPRCDRTLITSNAFWNKFDIPARPPGVDALIEDGVDGFHAGKLVDVTETRVHTPVYDSQGRRLRDLELKIMPDDRSNTPGENTSGTPTDDPAASDADASDDPDRPEPTSAAGRTVAVRAAAILAAVAPLFLL